MLSSNILKESTVNRRKPVEGLTLVIDGMEFSYGAFPILKGVTLDIGKPGLILTSTDAPYKRVCLRTL